MQTIFYKQLDFCVPHSINGFAKDIQQGLQVCFIAGPDFSGIQRKLKLLPLGILDQARSVDISKLLKFEKKDTDVTLLYKPIKAAGIAALRLLSYLMPLYSLSSLSGDKFLTTANMTEILQKDLL